MERIIKDFMCRCAVTCSVKAGAAKIAKIMLDNDVSALVALDEKLNACGVLSKTDLIGFYDRKLSEVTVEDTMTSELYTVSSNTLVYEAVQLMLDRKIHQFTDNKENKYAWLSYWT